MGRSAPWADSFLIIALKTVKQLLGINLMVLSAHWDDSLDIISLQLVKQMARD